MHEIDITVKLIQSDVCEIVECIEYGDAILSDEDMSELVSIHPDNQFQVMKTCEQHWTLIEKLLLSLEEYYGPIDFSYLILKSLRGQRINSALIKPEILVMESDDGEYQRLTKKMQSVVVLHSSIRESILENGNNLIRIQGFNLESFRPEGFRDSLVSAGLGIEG